MLDDDNSHSRVHLQYLETSRLSNISANRAARIAQQRRARSDRAPHGGPASLRPPSTQWYMAASGAISIAVFFLLWWMLRGEDVDAPWLPSGLAACAVMLVATAGREIAVRRAWARYARDMEDEMRGTQSKPLAPYLHPRMGVRASTLALRALQQRLAELESGDATPEAHLEAYKLCARYLVSMDEAVNARGVGTEVRIAVRAGKDKVIAQQKRHLLAWARGSSQQLIEESNRRTMPSDRVEIAQRAFDVIGEALKVYPDEYELQQSAIAVREFIASSKIAGWIEMAERAAFKGQHERAIDHYRDALFDLARIDIGDVPRAEATRHINREIEMLRALIATNTEHS